MKITRKTSVEAFQISDVKGLDLITVFWCNDAPGQGSVTITCYGCAWTCWFGAMCGDTIQEFFARADFGYLISKLGITPLLKQRRADHAYLERIIRAVKEYLTMEKAA